MQLEIWRKNITLYVQYRLRNAEQRVSPQLVLHTLSLYFGCTSACTAHTLYRVNSSKNYPASKHMRSSNHFLAFWLKCINLPKCTKFCSTRKLEVVDKNFGLLTKNCLMHWRIRGLKDSIPGIIWVVYSNL